MQGVGIGSNQRGGQPRESSATHKGKSRGPYIIEPEADSQNRGRATQEANGAIVLMVVACTERG